MDARPMGPRQPPDRRHAAAYDAIFRRPPPGPGAPPPFPPNPPQPPHPPYQFSPQPFQDRRTSAASFSSGYSHNGIPYSQHLSPGTYRQSYYTPPPHIAQHLSPPSFDHQLPAPYSHPPPRARSVMSASHSSDGASFHSEEPPDLNSQGLTPAQAYQAQYYTHDNSSGPQADRNRYRTSPVSPDRNSLPHPHSNHHQDLPRLGINIDTDDGRLGIDFTGSSGNSSDDGSSELPWVTSERSSRDGRRSHHQHSASNELSVDTLTVQSNRFSVTSISPASSAPDTSVTAVDHAFNGRRSLESTRTVPTTLTSRRDRSTQERSMSMSSTTASSRTLNDQKRSSRPFPSSEGRHSPGTVAPRQKKTPIVYPAVLSRVADAFRERILVGDRIKDGLTYKDAFDGREAVDKIAYIIKTTDRNLALLLGRALDAQKFFHDVTYDHRLRDSPNELYQFKTKLGPYVSGELVKPDSSRNHDGNATTTPSDTTPGADGLQEAEDIPLPSGVFTLLTDCYSPTCSRDRLCYSIACPRRLEQQARLNMKPQPGLSKQISKESLLDLPELGTIWAQSVPPEIVKSVSDSEAKRQETINEVIYTERDFVRDMEYLRDTWMQRLQESEVIPPERRSNFIQQVFWNVRDIIAVNTKLRDALTKRQKSYAVVDRIGDIFLEIAPQLAQPFVAYGAHQLYGKYEFEREKDQNPAFAHFVETTERLPESRKLELNAFLTKPTTRLARYPLLLESVLKNTPEDSSDKTMIPKAVSMIRELLNKLNQETGKTENRFNLAQLENQLYFKPGDEVDLKLKEPGREMITKGTLLKRDGEIMVHLFDHAILFTKSVKNKQLEHLRVYRRPIPLELLCISFSDDLPNTNGTGRLRKQTGLVRRSSFGREHRGSGPIIVPNEAKGQYWISFHHLGRKAYNLVLWATSLASQKKWVESIQKQQASMRERSNIFDCATLSEGFFAGPNKVNCAAPFSHGRKVVYGTDDGVYISDLREPGRDPVKVLSLLEVSQVDVLEEYQLMIVLSERQVITFPLDALDQIDPMAGLKRAKRISSHTSFFKAGFCLGRVLVCIVKSSQLSSTFKALEPIDQNIRGRSKPTFKKLLQGGNDTLKPFREFYIPVESTSIHYLKTKMCVGCSRGFEIVDLETLDTQGLLDPEDGNLNFVKRRENLRPMALYRIQNEFLLCYDEFAFYVNKSGQMTRKEFMVFWEGQPTGFALYEPYILAFDPNFIEIRHIETGYLAQVIQGSNLRLLFADSPPTTPKSSMLHPQHPPPGMMMSPQYGGGGGGGYGGYPGPPPPPGYFGQQGGGGGFGRQIGGGGPYEARDEILVCSDDRVFVLRPAAARSTASASASSVPSPSSSGQGHQSSMSMPSDFSWTSLPR